LETSEAIYLNGFLSLRKSLCLANIGA
jgi:hypothetical protein